METFLRRRRLCYSVLQSHASMQRRFWRPWVPQVVFIGRQWPCRCPNIIIAIVVGRTEQTVKPLCAPPPPPAAAADSTLHENMQMCTKPENISIKLHISGWWFVLERKKSIILIRVQASYLVLALSSTRQYHTGEMLQLRPAGFCSVRQKEKSGFISTCAAKLFCWEHCISLIIVLSVKWMRRNSWHNIMLQIQFRIDWQCEIHQAHVMTSCTIRAYCCVICIGKRGHLLGVIS